MPRGTWRRIVVSKKNAKLEENKHASGSIYQLDGRVSIWKAIPYGLQHVLAMFVANLAPIALITGAAKPELTQTEIGWIIQDAMFIAGLATLIQIYPLWRIGSRLPIVMGVSFTFVTVLSVIAANYGYPAVIGTVIAGGVFEGILGLAVRKIAKFIKPIVAATVVSGIGLSLLTVGVRSFGGGYTEEFGSLKNLIVATTTLIVVLVWMVVMKGTTRALSVLVAMVVG